MAPPPVRIGVIAFGGLILLFSILALAGWVEGSGTQVGLWKLCAGGHCDDFWKGPKCKDPVTDWNCDDRNDCSKCSDLNAARAFAVLAFLTVLGAYALLVVFTFWMENPKMLTFSTIAWGVAGFLAMVSFACGAEAFKDVKDAPGARYGWAFGLMVTVWIFSWFQAAAMWFVPDAGPKSTATA